MKACKTAGSILLLLAALLMGACGSGGEDPIVLNGFAVAEDPLVDAAITVAAPDGTEVQPMARGVTSRYGAFEVRSGALPAGATVMARGGTYQGRPFTGTLRATVPAGFQPSRDVLYLTPVTTLVSAYQAQRPGTTLAAATSQVHAMLKVPQGYDSAKLKSYSPALFSGAVFMAQAIAYQDSGGAGFDRFIQVLGAAAGQGASRTFVATQLGASAPIAVAEGTPIPAPDVTSTALTSIGGILAGAAFKQLLLQGFGVDIDGIATIQGQLDTLSTQLSTLGTDLGNMKVQIGCDLATFGNDVGVEVALPLMDSVIQMTPYLAQMAVLDPSSDLYKTYKSAIQRAMGGLEAQGLSMTIYGYIEGAGTSGLVRTYGNQIQKCKKFLNATSSAAVLAQWTYVSNVMAGACLLESAYLTWAGIPDDAQAAQCKTTYLPGVAALGPTHVIAAGSNWVIDMAQGYLWATLDFATSDCLWLLDPSGTPGKTPGFCGFDNAANAPEYYTWPVNVKARLDSLEASSQLTGWAVPSFQDTDWFLNGSARQAAATTQACLVKAGYVDGSGANLYGPGEIFLWVARDRVVHNSGGPEYGTHAMRWDGHVDDVRRPDLARVMAMRPVPKTEVYWRGIDSSAPVQWQCPDS